MHQTSNKTNTNLRKSAGFAAAARWGIVISIYFDIGGFYGR
jgi:hypothetical protein